MTESAFHTVEYFNALGSPTSFGGFENTMKELRLFELSNEGILDALPSPILDIGSGYEEFAIGLNAIAALAGRKTTVVSLNPQLVATKAASDGLAERKKAAIQEELLDNIEAAPAMSEYAGKYRKAVAGLVEHLPIRTESIRTVVSAWAYPEYWFEKFRPNAAHSAPLREIHRVLRVGGTALMGPIVDEFKQATMRHIIEEMDFAHQPFDVEFIPDDGRRGSFYANHRLMILRKT